MPTALEWATEINKRGLSDRLAGRNKQIYDELVKRGLMEDTVNESEFVGPPQPTLGQKYSMDEDLEALVPQNLPPTPPQTPEQKRATSRAYRPILEAGGMLAGGAIAGGTTLGVGTVVGGAGGFAAGKQIADRLDEFLGLSESKGFTEGIVQGAKDIRTGATYELGGQVLGPAIAGTAKTAVKAPGRAIDWVAAKEWGVSRLLKKMKSVFPDLSDEAILLKAREILEQVRSGASKKTIKETRELAGRLGIKTKFSFAQESGSLKAGLYEQRTIAKNAELADVMMGKDKKIVQEAVDSIEKQLGKKPGEIRDVQTALESHINKLTGTSEAAKRATAIDTARLQAGKRIRESGEKLLKTLSDAKKAEYARVSELYKPIPTEIPLGGKILKDSLRDVKVNYRKMGGGKEALPTATVNEIIRLLKPTKGKTITFGELRNLQSLIKEKLRLDYKMLNPPPSVNKHAANLKILGDAVDDSLDQMFKLGPKNTKIIEAYQEASSQFKEFYIDVFKTGEVGSVLSPGAATSGVRLGYSQIPERFFKTGNVDSAKELIRAVGRKEAATLIDDFAGLQLAAKETDGIIKPAKAWEWFKKNRDVLKEYGLEKKYLDIIKRGKIAEKAKIDLDEFSGTVANRIVGMDLNSIIPNLFSGVGRKASARTMNHLLNLPGMKGNAVARHGLKRAFKDYVLKEIDNKNLKSIGVFLDNVKPGLKVLYKDNPKQLQSLFDYHKLVRKILPRNKNISYTMGSAIAEKLTASFGSTVRSGLQLFAVRIGKGWYFSSALNLIKNIAKGILGPSKEQVEALLAEAVANPEVARTIMMAARRGAPQKVIQTRMRRHLTTLGLYQADRRIEE
jgi:hypothetical protein